MACETTIYWHVKLPFIGMWKIVYDQVLWPMNSIMINRKMRNASVSLCIPVALHFQPARAADG